jgi:sulfocyanin
MRVDEAGKTVEMDIVAGLTAANGSWNFNGHANGEMTVTVPAGWTVVMNFSSRDANVPHSLFITDKGPPYPNVMPEEPAIPRAYSINLQQGIGAGKSDVLRFPVEKSGRYFMVCVVPGHAASGMWNNFVVAAKAPRPTVEVKA